MSEQHLNDADVLAVLQQMGGKAMPQSMGGDSFVEAGQMSRFTADLLNGSWGDVADGLNGGKEPGLLVGALVQTHATRSEAMWFLAAVLTQHGQQTFRQVDIAVLGAFALLDTNNHAVGIAMSATLRLTASAIRSPAP